MSSVFFGRAGRTGHDGDKGSAWVPGVFPCRGRAKAGRNLDKGKRFASGGFFGHGRMRGVDLGKAKVCTSGAFSGRPGELGTIRKGVMGAGCRL